MLFNDDMDNRSKVLKYLGGISYNIHLMERAIIRLAFCIGEDNIKSCIELTYDLKSEYNGYKDNKSRTKMMEDLVKIFEFIHTAEDDLDVAYTKASLGVEDYGSDILDNLDGLLTAIKTAIGFAQENIVTNPIYDRNDDVTSNKILEVFNGWSNLNDDNLALVEKINEVLKEYRDE